MSKSKSNIIVGNQGWIDRINAKWRQSATSIIEAGQLLTEAKKQNLHGGWLGLFGPGKLDFDERTAQCLMKIARDPRLSNPTHASLLPKHWTTLYELTKLSDQEVEAAFAQGAITERSQRADVKRLRGPKPKVTDAEYQDLREETPERAAVDDSKAEPLFDEVDARLAAAAEPQGEPDRALQENSVDAEDAGGNPATYSDDPRAVRIEPASLLANGLAMIIRASREIVPSFAANEFPENMPLMSDELNALTGWLFEFEIAFRARYGVGNDAALQARARAFKAAE